MEKHQRYETQLTRETREGKKNPTRDMKKKFTARKQQNKEDK